MRTIDIHPLLATVGIDHVGKVKVTENMSGLEPNPKDDWLFMGLKAMREAANRKAAKITSMADIGSANGIDVIAALQMFPELKEVTVTDILDEILEQIRRNIEENVPNLFEGKTLLYKAGRDCDPVESPVDLVYGNLPLVMIDSSDGAFDRERATTTVTDAASYMKLAEGKNDPLLKYSMLSQLGFLRSAKEKLQPNGSIITLIGGRVPYEVIEETFCRAGLDFRELYCSFKVQSDPEFMSDYSDLERQQGVEFLFFDYERALPLLEKQLGIKMPDIIQGCDGQTIKALLEDTRLNAVEADRLANADGKPVGHLAYAFEAFRAGEGS